MDITSNTTRESTNCMIPIFIQHSCSTPHDNRIPGAFLQHWLSAANSADLHLASSGCDGASPVYHNRRGFRSTPFAALVNSTGREPPRPRHRPLANLLMGPYCQNTIWLFSFWILSIVADISCIWDMLIVNCCTCFLIPVLMMYFIDADISCV